MLTMTLLASAARTASADSGDLRNDGHRGVVVVVDVTAAAATPSVVFTIQGKDPLSGKYFDLLSSAAVTATGTTVLKCYPGITAAANAAVSDVLPQHWRVKAVAADADSLTYSCSAQLIN